jgi:hypothetical protein
MKELPYTLRSINNPKSAVLPYWIVDGPLVDERLFDDVDEARWACDALNAAYRAGVDITNLKAVRGAIQ